MKKMKFLKRAASDLDMNMYILLKDITFNYQIMRTYSEPIIRYTIGYSKSSRALLKYSFTKRDKFKITVWRIDNEDSYHLKLTDKEVQNLADSIKASLTLGDLHTIVAKSNGIDISKAKAEVDNSIEEMLDNRSDRKVVHLNAEWYYVIKASSKLSRDNGLGLINHQSIYICQ